MQGLNLEKRYFYHGRTFGAEALFNPASVMLNRTFYTLQIDNRTNDVLALPYTAGARNVFESIFDPIGTIDDYGWRRFLSHELIPTSFGRARAQWVPNYFGHLLGGGMVYRATAEWFEFHSYRNPEMLALFTVASAAFMNEVVENGAYCGTNVDPIADLYIFEPLGILLFRSDAVARFFSTTLNMTYWPKQPVYSMNTRDLVNVGHSVVYRLGVPFSDKVKLFYQIDVHSMLGVSYEFGGGRQVTLAKGRAVEALVDVDPAAESRTLSAKLVPTTGLFYERDSSLLMSLVVAPAKRYKLTCNVYPGLVRFGSLSTGLFGAIGRSNDILFGIHLSKLVVGWGASWS